MKKNLNSRDRIKIALSHKKPDRVPFALGGSAQKISNVNTMKMLKILGINKKPKKVLAGYSYMLYSLPLMQRCSVDIAYVYNKPSEVMSERLFGKTENYVDEWGFVMTRYPNFTNIGGQPLRNAEITEIKKYKGPDPCLKERVEGLWEEAKYIFENTDMAIAAHRPTPGGIFETCCWLRGTDQLLMDMIVNKKLVLTLLEKVTSILIGFYESQMKAIGKYVKIYELSDDLAYQKGLLISKEMYSKTVKPYHAAIVNCIKSNIKDSKIVLHSCGAVSELTQDFIEIGIDILNPIQPLAFGMETQKLKKTFGEYIVFQGGIDVQQAMRGDKKRISEEVKRRIEDLSENGGYIGGPSHNFGDDVPAENIIFAINEFRKFATN